MVCSLVNDFIDDKGVARKSLVRIIVGGSIRSSQR